MNTSKNLPSLLLYNMDRKTCQGAISNYSDLKIKYNLNAASEITLTVPKKNYDVNAQQDVVNPIYSKLQKNGLVRTDIDDSIFSFNGQIDNQDVYVIDGGFPRDTGSTSTYTSNVTDGFFSVQDETELFDIGSKSGYNIKNASYFQTGSNTNGDGGIADGSDNWSVHYQWSACTDFIPVTAGDVLAYLCDTDITNYYLFYYTDANPNTVKTNSDGEAIYTPLSTGVNTRGRIRITQTGYIRVEMKSSANTDKISYYPNYGYIKIFSGQHNISKFNPYTDIENVKVKLNWWVIDSIKEVNDDNVIKKEVTLKSYEYTLCNNVFSLSSDTLSLYIPDKIPELINSSSWVIDCWKSSSGSTIYETYGKQRCSRGLINQILDYLPNWKVGYINPEVCYQYRTIDDISNANVYNLLVNDIQTKYHCVFIFDTNNLTINILSFDDIVGIQSPLVLTWDRIIKSTNIGTSDNSYVTAMRVCLQDATYGLGLVNPTGNDYLYNFSSVKSQMQFVADTSQNRTLWEALTDWTDKYNNSKSSYRSYAKTLIDYNMKVIKSKTVLEQRLSDYRAKADMINVYLQDDYVTSSIPDNYIVSDCPRSTISMSNGVYRPVDNYKNYHSATMYHQLYTCAKNYEDTYSQLVAQQKVYDTAYSYMKAITDKLSFSISNSSSNCILSKTERKYLSLFLIYGEWQDENVAFSETYSSSDIYNTLVSISNNATKDLNSILSKPNYDFDISTVNLISIPQIQEVLKNTYIGNSIYVENSDGGFNNIALLSIECDYNNLENTVMSFSSNYKKKPIDLRFTDLFGSISQISVTTPTITFDD